MDKPTREEINVHDSPDERVACEHFFGKSLDEAKEMFRRKPSLYLEDLMWMGPRGFRFYAPAAADYFHDETARDHSEFVRAFVDTLEFWLKNYEEEVGPIAAMLASTCMFIIQHWDTLGLVTDDYVELKLRYIALEQSLRSMSS